MKHLNFLSGLLLVGSLLGAGVTAHAEDGVVKQDSARITEDKQNIQKDKQILKDTHAAIEKDKTSGDQAQLAKDEQAKKEAWHNMRQDKKRLHEDRKEEKSAVKNP